MTSSLLTEGDLDRGRPPDVAEHAPQRRDGSRELPPDMCLQGHQPRRWRQGWEPGKGRVFGCTVCGRPWPGWPVRALMRCS